MRVAITTTVTSVYDFPEGVTLEEVRREVLSRLEDHAEREGDQAPIDTVQVSHDRAAYLGEPYKQSSEVSVKPYE